MTEEAYETDEDKEVAQPWLKRSIQLTKVKDKANSFIVVFSGNDPFVPLEENRETFEKGLGAQVAVVHNKGHFTTSDGVTSLPVLLEYLK